MLVLGKVVIVKFMPTVIYTYFAPEKHDASFYSIDSDVRLLL